MIITPDLKRNLIKKYNEGKHFISFVFYHFLEDDCSYRASALAFTTLLAIVPLMSVSFAIFSAFPTFHELNATVQNFIFDNFVPTTGRVIQDYLQLFANQVTKLSFIGIIFLFITALLVMYTIEASMNKIWRVKSSRKGISAFFLYWSILSLAPILIGLSLVASSYFFSLPFLKDAYAPSILTIIPFALSLAGFTFLYVVVPNCPVKILDGLYGAVIATLLFESAKEAFAFYLTRYNTYQLLYGAFATIPIFFLWVYWVWLITLIGAEISYALSVHHMRRRGEKLDGFSHALLWLHCLWKAHREGRSVTLEELINTSDSPFSVDISDMLTKLSDQHLIRTTSDGKYLLARDLENLTLYDLLELLPYRLPNAEILIAKESPIAERWHGQIKVIDSQLQQELKITLDELFRDE